MKQFSLPTFLLTAAVLVASPCEAGVYRWVDANGVVHYGQAPPSPQAKGIAESPTQISVQTTSSDHARPLRMKGTWWGMMGSSLASLRFAYEDFHIRRYYRGDRPNAFLIIARGHYTSDGERLTLTYFSHEESEEKIDQTEVFMIKEAGPHELRLEQEGTEVYRFKRLESRTATGFSRRLKGEWKQEDAAYIRYTFDHGTVFVDQRQQYGVRRLRQGNWYWNDPELHFEFIADFPSASTGRDAAMKWNIHSISENRILAIKVGTGETISLIRERL